MGASSSRKKQLGQGNYGASRAQLRDRDVGAAAACVCWLRPCARILAHGCSLEPLTTAADVQRQCAMQRCLHWSATASKHIHRSSWPVEIRQEQAKPWRLRHCRLSAVAKHPGVDPVLVAKPVAAVGRCYYSGQHVVRLQPMALFPPLEAQDRASRLRANLCPAQQDIMGCLAPCLECLECPRHDLQTANVRHTLEIKIRIGKAWTSGGAVLRPTQLCRARMPRGCKIHAPQQRSRPGFLHRPSQSASPSPVLTGSEDQAFSRLDHKRR